MVWTKSKHVSEFKHKERVIGLLSETLDKASPYPYARYRYTCLCVTGARNRVTAL